MFVNVCRISKFVLILGILCVLVSSQTVSAQSPNEYKIYLPLLLKAPPVDQALMDAAIQLVTQRHNLSSSDLSVINTATTEYPLSDKSAIDFKVLDESSGEIYAASLDQSGAEVNLSELDAAEDAAYTALYGTLEPELVQLLATNPVSVPVILWLNEATPYNGPERPDPAAEVTLTDEEGEAYSAQVNELRAAAIEALVTPTLDQLTTLGFEATADRYSPAIYTSLSPQTITAVAEWPEVEMIYLDRINESAMDVARYVIGATTAAARGLTGYGVRIAQVEVGGRVAPNPYLSFTQNTTYACSSYASHGTGVAGIMRSTHYSIRGVAPSASLWAGSSCYGNSSQLQALSTSAASWGATALNLSWGANTNLALGINDRFYDNMTINQGRTVVIAAGNSGYPCSSSGNVGSPALAYNVISVGNFNDGNTTSWSGDTMSNTCSSWRDPYSSHNDREKPEIAAPGTNINSTLTNGGVGNIGSGTSFAAPMVAGASALLMQRNSTLRYWPETVKAILMTSAVHNIEGSSRLSEYDGAGGLLADRADDVAQRLNSNWGGQGYSCSTITPLNVTSMYLTGGLRTRVTITWDNDPNYAYYSSRPSADLDLQIINSAGSIVAGSYSWDNTYEIVDFTPSYTGYYTLRVNRIRCDYSPRYLGWAWRKGN